MAGYRTNKSSERQATQSQLAAAMKAAQAYFPNQRLGEETVKVYLADWRDIAERFGVERFENALGNVLRRADFFPLPKEIASECRALKQLSTSSPGSNFGLWRCDDCSVLYAGIDPPVICRGCGSVQITQTAEAEQYDDVAHLKYLDRIKKHPEQFVRVADVFREVAARRKAAGRPIPGWIDPRAGDVL